MITDKAAHTTTDTTFVVLEFAKSISEMEPLEMPQIVNWWWHRPTELHAEFADKRVAGFTHSEDKIDLHGELRENQIQQNLHLNQKPTFSGSAKIG